MNYTTYTLSTGKTVNLRSRTYAEWEKQEQERLAELEKLDTLLYDEDVRKANRAAQRGYISLRTSLLAMQMENFEQEKDTLTLREVEEIEKLTSALETEEIPLGNSSAGGDGPAT